MIKIGDIVKFTEECKKHYTFATDEYYKVVHIQEHVKSGYTLILDRSVKHELDCIVHSDHVEVCTKEVRIKKLKRIFE